VTPFGRIGDENEGAKKATPVKNILEIGFARKGRNEAKEKE